MIKLFKSGLYRNAMKRINVRSIILRRTILMVAVTALSLGIAFGVGIGSGGHLIDPIYFMLSWGTVIYDNLLRSLDIEFYIGLSLGTLIYMIWILLINTLLKEVRNKYLAYLPLAVHIAGGLVAFYQVGERDGLPSVFSIVYLAFFWAYISKDFKLMAEYTKT